MNTSTSPLDGQCGRRKNASQSSGIQAYQTFRLPYDRLIFKHPQQAEVLRQQPHHNRKSGAKQQTEHNDQKLLPTTKANKHTNKSKRPCTTHTKPT